jgi:hypothetical protein
MDSKFSDFLGVSYTFQGPNIDVKVCGIIFRANGKMLIYHLKAMFKALSKLSVKM